MLEAGLIVLGYLLGSFPTGVLLARARGVNIREEGSGNIGATNVARTLGKSVGVITLLVDCGKGAGPVLLGAYLVGEPLVVAGIGLAAVCGHVFSVFLRFRGGKGVATAFGVFLALSPACAGIGAGIFAVSYAVFRFSSVGSLLAAAAMPALLYAFGSDMAYVGLAGVILALILWTHRGNISRLLARREHKVF